MRKTNLRERLSWTRDSVTLAICKPFEAKAIDIRYKRSNPEGWEADRIYKTAKPILNHLHKKMRKSKKFSKRETDIALKLYTAFICIQEKQIGNHWEFLDAEISFLKNILDYQASLEDAVSPKIQQEVEAFAEVLNQLLVEVEKNSQAIATETPVFIDE